MKKVTTLLVAFCATTALWAAFTPKAFTVSAKGKQVYFSQGNLQCSGVASSNYTWSFAENQYDMLGTANVSGGTESDDATYGYSKSGSALADKIDLFGWSGSTGTAKWGISTSTSNTDYSGDFVDWGTNIIGTNTANTYRTLTDDEWKYLLNTRTNAGEKKGVARIKLSEEEYANGLILLPDSWDGLADITFKSGFADDSSIDAYATHQTFTLAQWQKLEAAGAVFLPASGYRRELSVDDVQHYGRYWSATLYGTDGAYCLRFDSGGASTFNTVRRNGQAVRLVQDVTKYAVTITESVNGTVKPDKTEAPEGETITLTVTPAADYELATLTVKDASENTIAVTDNKFIMPASDVTVSATFKAKTATAIENAKMVEIYAENGTIYGAEGMQIFTITGQNVTEMNGQLHGVYIVKVGDKAQKISVSRK